MVQNSNHKKAYSSIENKNFITERSNDIKISFHNIKSNNNSVNTLMTNFDEEQISKKKQFYLNDFSYSLNKKLIGFKKINEIKKRYNNNNNKEKNKEKLNALQSLFKINLEKIQKKRKRKEISMIN